MRVVITAPSLDTAENVSGIASIVLVIIRNDRKNEYVHFQVGRPDAEHRGSVWLLNLARMYLKWAKVVLLPPRGVIHFNVALNRLSLIRDTPMILAARAARCRIVVHVHGGRLFAQLPGTAWLRWVVQRVLTSTRPTIVLSAREAALFQKVSPRAAIMVLPNCVDLDDAQEFTREWAIPGPLTILFMGRIEPAKGLDVICGALEILRERSCRVRFVLAGTGPDEERYKSWCRDLLGPDFTFAGVVSGGAKVALLRSSDVFLLPSLFEGLPMALLESMAYGLVPITTDVGSMGDVIADGQNGILLGERPAEEIATAIQRLSSEPALRERLGVNARRFVFEHHDPVSYVARLNEIYVYE